MSQSSRSACSGPWRNGREIQSIGWMGSIPPIAAIPPISACRDWYAEPHVIKRIRAARLPRDGGWNPPTRAFRVAYQSGDVVLRRARARVMESAGFSPRTSLGMRFCAQGPQGAQAQWHGPRAGAAGQAPQGRRRARAVAPGAAGPRVRAANRSSKE